jgi:ribosomal protein S18 acetylase RimI-like enzyme
MIRQLTADDAEQYQVLRLRGLQESPTAFSASYSDEVGRSIAEIQARLTPTADGSRTSFGAFVGDQLAGIVAIIRSERAKIRHCVELVGMYVAPDFRRRGLGAALVDRALAHACSLPGVRQVKLGVNATNLAARSLYQSRGFACVGVEPDALCIDGRYYDEEMYFLRVTTVDIRQ